MAHSTAHTDNSMQSVPYAEGFQLCHLIFLFHLFPFSTELIGSPGCATSNSYLQDLIKVHLIFI